MELTGDVYFWQRAPQRLNRLAVGSLASIGALAAVVGGVAAAAQSLADRTGAGEDYSLTMHVVAMVALASLAVAVASTLAASARRTLAGLVLLGTVAGPMTIVAAPVRASLVTASDGDTTLWWHAAVGGLVLTILAAWTVFATRCLVGASVKTPRSLGHWMSSDLLFTVVAGLGVLGYLASSQQSNTPAFRAVVGWAVLAAGITVAVASGRWWAGVASIVGVGLVLWLVFLAYSRTGGWPGVAGWEYEGMESPIITSVASTVTLLAAPLLGAVLHALRYGSHVLRPQPASAEPVLAL